VLFVVLLLSITWVVAQDSSTEGSQSSQPGSSSSQSDQSSSTQASSGMSSGSETSIEGCLNGSAGSYTLTSSTGSTYQLTGSTDDLSQHVNQQVRLKGTPIAVSASASTSPSGTSSSSTPSSSTSSSSAPAIPAALRNSHSRFRRSRRSLIPAAPRTSKYQRCWPQQSFLSSRHFVLLLLFRLSCTSNARRPRILLRFGPFFLARMQS
jgi:hypothetical protein